ncbi:MAG: translation initiation factor IF-2, partial [Chlamydiia bacterium]|nr:translation initiation factor IF-2 [Chlamydiia bacterium]
EEAAPQAEPTSEEGAPELPKVKARSRSIFAEEGEQAPSDELHEVTEQSEASDAPAAEEVRPIEASEPAVEAPVEVAEQAPVIEQAAPVAEEAAPAPVAKHTPAPRVEREPRREPPRREASPPPRAAPRMQPRKPTDLSRRNVPVDDSRFPKKPKVKLGPTGRHINDLLPPKRVEAPKPKDDEPRIQRVAPKPKPAEEEDSSDRDDKRRGGPPGRRKEFKDVKPLRGKSTGSRFDSRDRRGLRENEEGGWRRKRHSKQGRHQQEDLTIRPTTLSVRLPIIVKDLAAAMKLKASELIQKLFLQGFALTINDVMDDETTVQFLGSEFGCEIVIDTSAEERIRITDKSIMEEIAEASEDELVQRPPVVAFMGHVDHGKTSLIDRIRSSNRASEEAGAITQHIGAFRCSTSVGELTILDTPGHEAFSAMRARGADVTDIVVLVVAGDEGLRQQTLEAIQHARAAKVQIVVAVNKCDKPGFDIEKVYRQLADNDLLPEAWGGETICVPCSAVTGVGINELLEMLALQSEVLELRAHPGTRARGRVLESEMHKGMGVIATVLVQNGTLNPGDCLVFDQLWGRVKTMRNEHGKDVLKAGPSVPVEITGLAGIPSAGEEFIVVSNEKEAREIGEARIEERKQKDLAKKKRSMSVESLFQEASDAADTKVLNVVLRADVQGSLEALKTALTGIESNKVRIEPIFAGVGEVSESDVQLAAASKAVIVGFHTKVESHAESLLREHGVRVYLFEVIYHAIDEVKALMSGLLDRIAKEEERGSAEVQAVFKSSQLGKIAGCIVREGSITRNCQIRVMRGREQLWRGPVHSLKRHKDDVKEVAKGLECGIVLNGFNDFQVGDTLDAFEVTYIEQEL